MHVLRNNANVPRAPSDTNSRGAHKLIAAYQNISYSNIAYPRDARVIFIGIAMTIVIS